MITKPDDLLNRYVLRSDKEVFEKYLDFCWLHGIKEKPREQRGGDAMSYDAKNELLYDAECLYVEAGYTKITMEDFAVNKKTKTEYVKVEFGKPSEAVTAWEDGELYTKVSDNTFAVIDSAPDVLRYLYRLYKKVEVEIPWYERLDDFSYPLALIDECGDICQWNSATEIEQAVTLYEYKFIGPATKAEIKVLLDNAPE
jgi:hypothetical protein